MTTVDAILDRWPLDAMLGRLGVAVPPKGKFCSPFRPDKTPSCEIYQGKIVDRTSGHSYDSISCFGELKGLSNADAIKALAAELPGREPKPEPPVKPPAAVPQMRYSLALAQKLATQRGLGIEGVDMAGCIYKTLGFANYLGHECWFLFDAGRRHFEYRRLDGELIPEYTSPTGKHYPASKAKCITGRNNKRWPLGLCLSISVPPGMPVVLVEGMPDYLAACELAFHAQREFLPVAMLGTGASISPDALPLFAGRSVRILAHPGEAGATAASKWAAQLQQQQNSLITAEQLDGGDLNELVVRYGGKTLTQKLKL